MTTERVLSTVARLDAWLDTMRGPHGYTGPIAHWWESSLLYTGAQFDWRYEGVIAGYLALHGATDETRFLDKAIRAGDDVVAAQLPDGRFRASSFQFGPVRGGTPHEAAVDVALLALAETLGSDGDRFLRAAEANVDDVWIGTLWDGVGFRDQPYNPVHVANKHGTLLEALLKLERVNGREVDPYVRACIEAIRTAVVQDGPQGGATVHLGIGPSRLAIPIYTARAMNGVLSYFTQRADQAVLPMLRSAAEFLTRSIAGDGVIWGIYGNGRPCPNPRIVAGAGDVLRFLTRMDALDLADAGAAVGRLVEMLVSQQRDSGAIPTAHGFARKGLGGTERAVDLRDELPVVGWIDKAFRALSELVPRGATLPAVELETSVAEVRWRGRTYRFVETVDGFEVVDRGGRPAYAWRKGERAPRTCRL